MQRHREHPGLHPGLRRLSFRPVTRELRRNIDEGPPDRRAFDPRRVDGGGRIGDGIATNFAHRLYSGILNAWWRHKKWSVDSSIIHGPSSTTTSTALITAFAKPIDAPQIFEPVLEDSAGVLGREFDPVLADLVGADAVEKLFANLVAGAALDVVATLEVRRFARSRP